MALNKTVMKLDMNGCYKCKKVALHSVTKIEGIDSLSINLKDNTLTVIGEADSVTVANMLRRKFRCAEMISGGPMPPPPPPPKEEEKPKEPEKQEEPKKEEPKKEEEKPKEEEKKEEEKPKEEKKEEEKPKEEEKKEENPKAEEKKPEPEEEKKPEKKEEPVVVAQSALSPQPMWYQVCDAQCYPPCSACSSRPEIMWPRYHQPGSGPNEVWYVWNEEKQESCTIM